MLIFYLASMVAELLAILWFFAKYKTYLGPMLPPGSRNWQLISPHKKVLHQQVFEQRKFCFQKAFFVHNQPSCKKQVYCGRLNKLFTFLTAKGNKLWQFDLWIKQPVNREHTSLSRKIRKWDALKYFFLCLRLE